MKIKAAHYIADFLVQHGVSHMFTVTGGGAMHLNDAFGHKAGMKCIYNHHEQACAIAAEGYTRLTGNVAGVCVTSGPGGTNALTGVLGGWLDSIPMFIISGQVKTETTCQSSPVPLRQLGDQEFTITECVKTMTKYAQMIISPQEIRYHLEKAWFLCQHGRGGPVWLDIPLDVQAAIIETEELTGYEEEREKNREEPQYNEVFTGKIADKLFHAQRPVVLAGTGIRLSGAYNCFLELADRLGIPIVTAWNAHDVLWEEHPLYCGRPGTVGTRGGNFIIQNSDVLLVLGCRLNIRQISYNYKEFAKNAYKIVVDIDNAELQKPTVRIDLPIHANVKDVMHSLLRSGYKKNPSHMKWLEWCRTVHAKYPAVLPEYYKRDTPVNPYVFIKELSKELDDKDKVICGNGGACVVTFQAIELKRDSAYLRTPVVPQWGTGYQQPSDVPQRKQKGRFALTEMAASK